MASGIQKTLQFLGRTRNEAAVSVLVAALDSVYPSIRTHAVGTLASRPESAGHEALINRVRQLGDPQLHLLRRTKHRMHNTLAAAVNSADSTLCDNATRMILALAEYEMFSALISAVERPNNSQAGRVAAALIRLAKLLVDEAKAPPSGKPRRDPFFARRQAITEMSRSLDRYHQHQRLEILEAYLLLVPHDHATLARLLANSAHPCHQNLLESLSSSPNSGVMRLLSEFLQDPQAPKAVLDIVAHRIDRHFLEYLLHSLSSPIPLRVLRNMERLRRVAWLQDERHVLLELDGPAQAAAVELAMASSLSQGELFVVLAGILAQGETEGRCASCEALAEIHDPRADRLVENALDDHDISVRAAAARQLRRRVLPNVRDRLVALLDSGSPELREAAGSALSEYCFVRYVSNFADMDDQERRTTGRIVAKTDPAAAGELIRELSAPSPTQRQRAIDMAQAMDLVTAVAGPLIKMLEDKREDVALRAAAAEALASCSTDQCRAALATAKKDPNLSIRKAAANSLAIVGENPLMTSIHAERDVQS